MTPLPILDAIEQASHEHDDSLGANHPWRGWGAPAREVAQVIFIGATTHTRLHQEFARRGMKDLSDLLHEPWNVYERVRDEVWAAIAPAYETDSQRAKTVAMLMRAERLGLVKRRLTHPTGGHTYWYVA